MVFSPGDLCNGTPVRFEFARPRNPGHEGMRPPEQFRKGSLCSKASRSVVVANEAQFLRPQASLFGDADLPVGLDEYQQFTAQADRSGRSGMEGLGFVLLGLFGEV